MKKLYLYGFVSLTFFISFQCTSSINNLNNVEVSNRRFAPQIMFEFSNPLYFEKQLDKEKLQLRLDFPGMDLKNFQNYNLVLQLKKIEKLIKNVSLEYKKVPSPRVVLTITFAKKDILLRWSKMEDPNILVIDIFRKKNLNRLKNNRGANLLYAQNDVLKNDFTQGLKKKNISDSRNKKIRVVIDAGHGGSDFGAKGFFSLNEKNVNLDIARRVKIFLKKNGFDVFLTRNNDKDISLVERTEIANLLKADLFVSIHANAAPAVGNASGLETFYLNPNKVLSPQRFGGFLFLFENSDSELEKKADKLLSENIDLSKKLADSIQESVLNLLKSKNIEIVDRGVKKTILHNLLRGEIPTTFVEVGFLTNKKEAKKLTIPGYRQMLAQGIGEGIKNYIYSHH